jgi:hypothetical protein
MTEREAVTKKLRTFRASKKGGLASSEFNLYDETVEKLVKTIACDYKVWQLQWDAYHDEMGNTMARLIDSFTKLQDLTQVGPDSKVLSINRDKEKA